MTSLEDTQFILALGTDQFLIYFLFIQIMRSKLKKVANLMLDNLTVTS